MLCPQHQKRPFSRGLEQPQKPHSFITTDQPPVGRDRSPAGISQGSNREAGGDLASNRRASGHECLSDVPGAGKPGGRSPRTGMAAHHPNGTDPSRPSGGASGGSRRSHPASQPSPGEIGSAFRCHGDGEFQDHGRARFNDGNIAPRSLCPRYTNPVNLHLAVSPGWAARPAPGPTSSSGTRGSASMPRCRPARVPPDDRLWW